MSFFGPGGLSSGGSSNQLDPQLIAALQKQFPQLAGQQQPNSLSSLGYAFPGVQLYQGQGTGSFGNALSPFESAGGVSPESITGGLAMGSFGKSSSQQPVGQGGGFGNLSLPSLNLPMAQVAAAQAGASGDQGLGGTGAEGAGAATSAPSGGIGVSDIVGGAGQALNYFTGQGQTTGPQTPGMQEQRAGERVDYTNATGSPSGIPQAQILGLSSMSSATGQTPLASQPVDWMAAMQPGQPNTLQLSPSDLEFLQSQPQPSGLPTMGAPGGSAQTALGNVSGDTSLTGVGQGLLGAAGGLYNAFGSAQQGNIGGAAMGGLQTLGGLTSALQSSPQLVNTIASQLGVTGEGLSGALSGVGGAVGGIGGIYSLVQGVQSGDPMQIISGLVSAYTGGSQLAGALLGQSIPGVTSLIATVAPETAAAVASALGVNVAANAGAQAIGAALSSAVSGIAAGAALPAAAAIAIVTNMIASSEEFNARSSGWWNNPVKGQLYSGATEGVANAQKAFDALNQGGNLSNVDTASLADALTQMSSNLLPYYTTAQGGTGPIRASDTLTGGSGMTASTASGGLGGAEQYTQNFTNAQHGFMSVVNELLKRGVPYEELGKLPVTGDWAQRTMDLADPLQQLYQQTAAKYGPEGQQLLANAFANGGLERTGLNNENYLGPVYGQAGQESRSVINPADYTPEVLLQKALGAAQLAPESVTHASGLYTQMYGGPLWAAIARMGGAQGNFGADIQNAITQHFDPWVNARTETPQQLLATLGVQGMDLSGVPAPAPAPQWDPYWQNIIGQRAQQQSAQDPMQQALQQYMQQLSSLQTQLPQLTSAAQTATAGGLDPNLVAALQGTPGFSGGNGAFSPTQQGAGGVDLAALLQQLGYAPQGQPAAA